MFYTLHAIATMVSDSVAYRNVVCLSHIVDADGKKMSKSLGNILDPYDVFDSVGADALRWYFLARVAPDVQKRISVDIVADVASSFINTFWNTYAFFVLYARLDDVDLDADVAPGDRAEIDRWALALLERTERTVREALDAFDARTAGEAIEAFVDQLSNWYVRRNRRRFWKSAAGDDKQAAYLTLYECLERVHRMMAPMTPFLAESVYQNLVRSRDRAAPLSVHMTEWPLVDPAYRDDGLIAQIAVVQKVVGLGRAARNTTGLKTRQPLARVKVRVPDEAAAAAVIAHQDQVLEELNIKSIEFIARDDRLVDYRLKPNLPRIGRKYGRQVPAIRAALAAADGAAVAAACEAGQTVHLDVDGDTLAFEPADILIETDAAAGFSCAEDGGYLVALDTEISAELRLEGLARELIRSVQDARKQAGFDVSDRIRLEISGTAEVEAALAGWRRLIMDETLAMEWGGGPAEAEFRAERSAGDAAWTLEISRL
ncbi:MAG: DUF5915 domain-containing protein [Pseudomonadota bacterium]